MSLVMLGQVMYQIESMQREILWKGGDVDRGAILGHLGKDLLP